MGEIVTNRDLYLAVTQLVAQYHENQRPLEEYLLALWSVATRYRERTALTLDEFFDILVRAFTVEPGVIHLNEEFWQTVAEHIIAIDEAEHTGFLGFDHRAVRQIIDLREMAEGGQLANGYRYLGIDSPRGSRWYNFDPCTFLECGVTGTFGGWDEGGEITPLGEISWERFRDFLLSGQAYE